MLRYQLESLLKQGVENLIAGGMIQPAEYPEIAVELPKQAAHGDFACTWALAACKIAGTNPRALAELLLGQVQNSNLLSSVEIAGPGFLNFKLNDSALELAVVEGQASESTSILENNKHFGRPATSNVKRINVEFVSVNPNGPITIGSGRGAAYGSALCNVLQAAGNEVHREYYINDGVNSEQMRLFALSVREIAQGRPVPDNGYKGDYVAAVAEQLKGTSEQDLSWWQSKSQELMLAKQKYDLEVFGVLFDTWFSEQSLHDNGTVERAVNHLVDVHAADDDSYRMVYKMGRGGVIEEKNREEQPADDDDAEGSGKTLWLRSTKFGDDRDRVLKRKDGRLTYIASDVAYHMDKLNRPVNATNLITVLGPDHHGYVARLHAVMAANLVEGNAQNEEACQAAVEKSRDILLVQLYQLVQFLKEGKPAPMRKRDGNIYALIDLINEIGETVMPSASIAEKQRVGRDVARYFYLMRHHDTTFDFDLDLATTQSDDNPVFYVQYAHARICAVLEKAGDILNQNAPDYSGELHEKERNLIIKCCELSNEVLQASREHTVNRIANYSIELARAFHAFYDSCRVVNPDDIALSHHRIRVCKMARTALAAALELLGVSAPTRMERASSAS